MTVDFVVQNSFTLASKAFSESRTVTGADATIVEASIPAATAGTLTTRTSDTAGIITVTSHSFSVNDIIDIYWSDGSCRTATISAEDTTTLTFSGALGTVLPAQDDAVTCNEQVVLPFNLVGADCTALVVFTAQKGTIILKDAGGEELVLNLATGGTVYAWWTGNGVTNPITGDTIITVTFSHDYITAAAAMRIGAQT